MSTETANIHTDRYSKQFQQHLDKEKAAVKLMSFMGQLLYNKGVELVLFRSNLMDRTVSEIMHLHEYARNVVKQPIDIHMTMEIAREINNLVHIKPSKLDIGRLAKEWIDSEGTNTSIEDFIDQTLKGFIGDGKPDFTPKDVVLFGFGRIGRLAARRLVKQAGKGQQLRLRAIVTRTIDKDSLKKRAALMRNDSVHGRFAGTIEEDYENMSLRINGQLVQWIAATDPVDIDYESYGLSNVIVIDNTGVYKDREGLGRHLKSKGVNKVILTAPGKEVPNIVYGVNHKELDREKENIISAASCTTNAIVPVLKVINDTFGIETGHIESVHAYTNDQNLLDNMHKKARRGRAAALNMVITSTGAGKAVAKVIPSLKDKLTANAVRVPTPNGSLAIMNLLVGKETSVEEVNETLRSAALQGPLVNQIDYRMDEELVSSDIIGNQTTAVFDSNATIVHPDKKHIVLYTWYDNEYGYTKQVIRLTKYVAKVDRLMYY